MNLGTAIPSYWSDRTAVPPSTIREWAEGAEAAGFAGLWVMDHLVEPESYQTTVLDPLVTLSYAASVTETIPLGTSVLLLPLRRTAVVASQAASLQYLADRPVTLGVGTGYVPEEFEVTGVPMGSRGPRLNEGLAVLRRLFDGESSYEGRFHEFENVRVDPVSETPPRLLAGGSAHVTDDGDRTFPPAIADRILTADGWITPPVSPTTASADWTLLDEYANARGASEDVDRVLLNYVHLVDDDDPEAVAAEQREVFESFFSSALGFEYARKHCLVGAVDEVLDSLREYEEIGFDQIVLGPATREPDAISAQLELLATELVPHFGGR